MSLKSCIQCLGWSFRMLSIMLLTWSCGELLTQTTSLLSGAQICNLVLLLCYAGVFAICSAVGALHKKLLSSDSTLLFALILFVAGYVLVDFASNNAQLVGFALMGAGEALTFIVWQRIFANRTIYNTGNVLFAGTILGTLLYACTLLVDLNINYLYVTLVAELISLLLTAICLYLLRDLKNEEIYTNTSIRLVFPLLWRSVLCVAFFGLMWELVASFGNMGLQAHEGSSLINCFAQLIGIGIFIPFWIRFHGKIELILFYQISFPIIATCYLLMPFFGGLYQQYFVALSYLMFGLVSVLMQITCLQVSKQTGEDPGVALSYFASIVYFSMALGCGLGTLAFPKGEVGFQQAFALALLAVYLLALIMFVIRIGKKKTENHGLPAVPSPEEFEEKIRLTSQKFRLTDREQDVFRLILIGRDLPYIAEELFISKNTVRSHSKNLYRKMGVHSKQELINLMFD